MSCNAITGFKSGFVSIIGAPNAGKSTLMNTLIGDKIAITSAKPQTTRNKIQGILTRDGFQAVFVDTPGMHKPKNKLGEYMQKSAENTINDADIIMLLVEPLARDIEKNRQIIEKIKAWKFKQKNTAVIFLVVNKIDLVEKAKLLELFEKYGAFMDFNEIIPISALKAENTDILLNNIQKYLPDGPMFFPDDCITDQPEKQICAEIIREKILYIMQEEIPHGVAVEVTSMKERLGKNLIDIEATIFCEKESHKGMIIGKNGSVLKKIGVRSREDIERFVGAPVNLQLWVKVKENWRDSDFLLRNFGYN